MPCASSRATNWAPDLQKAIEVFSDTCYELDRNDPNPSAGPILHETLLKLIRERGNKT